MENAGQQKLIIITAPSGAGKTSITKYLMQQFPVLAFSISAATRAPRSFETNGVDYYFITADDFKQKIQENAFIEWEMVYEGKYYGTLKAELQRIWDAGKIPVLDIDVKGAIKIEKQLLQKPLSIFVEPPSVDELRKRLESRGTETADTLEARVNKAAYEISFKNNFDVVVVNDNLDVACAEAHKVIAQYVQQ
jgi:guanylate kinase